MASIVRAMWWFLLASIGLTFVMVESPLMSPLWGLLRHLENKIFKRDWFIRYLSCCYACSGFWAGLAMAIIAWFVYHRWWTFIILPFGSSIASYTLSVVISFMAVIANKFGGFPYASERCERWWKGKEVSSGPDGKN